MIAIKNLFNFKFRKKYGLLVSDTDVVFVSWKSGDFERIAVFGNDDAGVDSFNDFLLRNERVYKNCAFQVLTNVIGEDYRVERVAHLIGKYKTDFHRTRMQQLFRGSSFSLSVTQGREELGRREDIVLFYGIITEAKVLPWVNAILRGGDRYLTGVYGASFVNAQIMKSTVSNYREGNHLLMTLHEKGLLRQTYFAHGNLRFSRVSKIRDDSAEDVAASIRKELERTIQYLNSLKISVSSGLSIQFICPTNMVAQLRELIKSGERVRFFFHDAAAVAQSMDLSSSIEELGKDSSLSLHSMFSYFRIGQLAPFERIRYYWVRSLSRLAIILFAAYGSVGLAGALLVLAEGYGYKSSNQELTERRNAVKDMYENEFRLTEDPPSTTENITAVTRTFNYLTQIKIAPSQLIYYFARAFSDNKKIAVNDMRWYVTGNPQENNADIGALLNGGDIYQILEVSGEFLPLPNETYIDVANRSKKLIASFEERPDVLVEVIELPTSDIPASRLSAVLNKEYDIDAAEDRVFRLRIIWKEYDEVFIKKIAESA